MAWHFFVAESCWKISRLSIRAVRQFSVEIREKTFLSSTYKKLFMVVAKIYCWDFPLADLIAATLFEMDTHLELNSVEIN
jgi:hypothetical protein